MKLDVHADAPAAAGLSRPSFVMTTVNQRALDASVGPTDAIEIVGGHSDDAEPTLEAVRKAVRSQMNKDCRTASALRLRRSTAGRLPCNTHSSRRTA